jgi:4-hydroxythreonine-4-phosphate dehydrogenase
MIKVAISIGDINGIGIELALTNHHKIKKYCSPIYCIDKKLLKKASKKLNIAIPKDFCIVGKYPKTKIKPSHTTKSSGLFSYYSFKTAIGLASNKKVDAICTLPINKEAWKKAGINYVGHTDMLRDIFKQDAIMMLGCDKMYVALFTEHIPLKNVPKQIKPKKLKNFFYDFYNNINVSKNEPIAVLGIDPHLGDNGAIGTQDQIIKQIIKQVNKKLKSNFQLLVADVAFTKQNRNKYKYYCAMYHDVGLATLKALYFEQSINVSLNLPILRTSVDHGTAFDIAYQNKKISNKSYINAIKFIKKYYRTN